MTNFIFKSSTTLKKLANTLQVILAEQRLQRADLQEVKFMLHKLQSDKNLQETVDKYYKDAPDFEPPATGDLD